MHEVLAHAATLLCLVAVGLLPGYALERYCLRDADLAGLRALARAVLGIAAWMLALFALAAAGALRGGPMLGVAVAFAAAATAARWRFGPARDGAPGLAFLAAASLATAPFWIGALDHRVAWDAGSYHLALPQRYLEAGGFRALPFNVYAVWPHATELLFAGALRLRDAALATALHSAFGVLALWAAYLGARAAGRPFAGWLAAPLALANPVLAFELGVAYVDLAAAFFFTAGVVFAARAVRGEPFDLGALTLAGVCGGALAGIKINGVLAAAAIASLALPRALALARTSELRSLTRLALALGLPLLALWLPWVARSAWLTGNPAYPFFYDLFGGPDWSAALGERFARWQRGIGMGRGPLDWLLLPARVVVSGGPDYAHFGGRLGLHWLVWLPLAVVLGWRVPLVRRVFAACAVYFALWALGSQQARFLIPLLPPLALGCALAIDAAIERLAPGRAQALRAGAAVLAVAGAWIAVEPHYAQAFARLPALRAEPAARRAAAQDPVFLWANAALPSDARVLLLDTNQTWFLARESLADSFFEASQLADWLGDAHDADAAAAKLAARGVTHVLWDRRRDWGIPWPAGLRDLLADPARATRRYRSPDGLVEVYELASTR
jgi:hypothetical protein